MALTAVGVIRASAFPARKASDAVVVVASRTIMPDDDDTYSVVEDLSEGGEGSEPNSIEVNEDDCQGI